MKRDHSWLKTGLSRSGKLRAVAMQCRPGEAINHTEEISNGILAGSKFSLWVDLESRKIESPDDWCAEFARNLRASTDVYQSDLSELAHAIGSSLRRYRDDSESDEETKIRTNEELAIDLVSKFETFATKEHYESKTPHVVFSISGLDQYSDDLLSWLSGDLNQALRQSSAFKESRFVFSGKQYTDREKVFFDTFGFEKVHFIQTESGEEDSGNIQANSKSLKKDALSTILNTAKEEKSTMDFNDEENLLSSFSKDEQNYLYLASYPTRISRYSLEHFAPDREAALAYNWLKRQKSLHSVHSSGDLLLNEKVRNASKVIHSNKNPEVAQNWITLASVLDALHEVFPIDSTHWIPVNLQLIESFDQRMLNILFNDDQLNDVISFLDHYPQEIIEKEGRFSLSDNAKLITRRYMELTNRSFLPGLDEMLRQLWLKDLDHYNSVKVDLTEEKEGITSEIEDTIKQVASLNELKKNLLKNFRNPKRNKPERIYSFSTSLVLILLGLGTIGASLLTEGIGAYHAACGLALTAFGFFWPNVETKQSAIAGVAGNSNLAIETQQRSLNHRAGSLTNRVQVMKGNLEVVDNKLKKLGESPPPPYLDLPDEDSATPN